MAAAALIAATMVAARDDAGDLIRRAKKEADAGRIVEAESTFARAERMASGDDRSEAMVLHAAITPSAAEARRLYESVLRANRRDEWSAQAALELGKIHFAMGRYEEARDVLRDADACASSEEACLFEGLALLQTREFDEALSVLGRVHQGRDRTWAAVAMAEAEAGAGRDAEACSAYESLARARISPTAWYRYAECLEESGDRDGARREYEALQKEYPQTPEAVRAAAKLAPPPAPPPAETATTAGQGEASIPPGRGFTVQFGSFADRANAIKLAAKIKKTYPNVRIDSELIDYREVFRVRYGYYASRDEAKAAGQDMSQRLGESFTVMPVRTNP